MAQMLELLKAMQEMLQEMNDDLKTNQAEISQDGLAP
jgi:hypothetical protein